MAEQKLIVVSTVDASSVQGLVQGWSVSSLEDNLRRQRRVLEYDFLPVAAFEVEDVGLFTEMHRFLHLPASTELNWLARHFGWAQLDPRTRAVIFRHYATLVPETKDRLFAAWEVAVALGPVEQI